LLEVPQMETSHMKQHLDNLLQEASEDDAIHDVVFQVTVYILPVKLNGNYVHHMLKIIKFAFCPQSVFVGFV
jgi:hypothetical protein